MLSRILAGGVALAWPAAALAGPDWTEMGDAGRLPPGAQPTMGAGPLGSISGMLAGVNPGGGDFEDMYVIRIVDPVAFSAQTEVGDGFTDFDTQLWLFDMAGLGLLGNDDTPVVPGNAGSFIALPTTDGTPVSIAPGLYLLAISGFDDDPVSSGGAIFDQPDPMEISGPDGPGGMTPIIDWNPGKGATGSYRIFLEGTEFAKIPAPGTLALLLLAAAALGAGRRRRRA